MRWRLHVGALLLTAASGCGLEGPPSELAEQSGGAAAADAAPAMADLDVPVTPTDPAWPDDVEVPAAFDLVPWLTMPDPRTISIGWRASAPMTGWVEWVASNDGRLDVDWATASRLDSAELATLHHVRLVDLAPATTYRYRVHLDHADGEAVREGVFVTPGADAWRFVHLAEFHAPTDAARVAAFADPMRRFRPHLAIESGDMVDDGGELDHWRSYVATSKPWISNVILLPAHSNHVNGSLGSPILRTLFELPDNERWYTTRFGAVDVVTLDSTYTLNPDVATEPGWVVDRLATDLGTDDAPEIVIAAWHYPACSSNYAERTAVRRYVIDQLLPAFAAAPLGLVLVGHDKYYERSRIHTGGRTLTQVMANVGRLAPGTRGGGEPECTPEVTVLDHRSLGLYRVRGGTVVGDVIDERNQLLDHFTVVPP